MEKYFKTKVIRKGSERMMNKELNVEPLCGTKQIEFVDYEELARAFVISQCRQYNKETIECYDGYLAISSPSPKYDFRGIHKTLYTTIDDFNDMNEFIDVLREVAFAEGIKAGISKSIETLEKLKKGGE